MSNTIGSALVIPTEVLKSISTADAAFKQLQTTGTTAATEIGGAFRGVAAGGVRSFILSIQEATKALKEMAHAADAAAVKAGGVKMGNGTKDLGNDAKQAQTSVTQLVSAIDALRQSLGAMPKSGGMVEAFTDAFAKQTKEIDDLKKHYEELLKKRQEVANASTGSGSGSGKDGSVGNTMNWEEKVAWVKSNASAFASNKNAFGATEYTQLVAKLQAAQEVLKSSTADLTATEQKQTLELVEGLKQRIRMRETEAKLVANQQVSVQEADAYAKQAKTLGELTNAMEMYKRARANVDVTTKDGGRQAQELTDKIAALDKQTKALTTSTEKKAEADRKAAEAEWRGDTKVARVMSDASAFAANKQVYNNHDYAFLVTELKKAQEVLRRGAEELSAAEQKQTMALIEGLKQRIKMRETEAKLVANQQVSVKEANAYAKQAKTLGELTNAMEMYKRARANVNVTNRGGERLAQVLTDKIAVLDRQTKALTMSTEKKAEADRRAAAAATRRLAAEQGQEAGSSPSEYGNALSFASIAKTTQQRAQAIRYLIAAKQQLEKGDESYQEKLNRLNAKIQELSKAQRAAADSARELSKSHYDLMGIGGQLMRQLALIFSFSQIKSYIKQVAQVRGEFEMAQRSLQAILASKNDADKIFSQTLSLALQSPYKIKDLIQYTRQLAAYRIENDKLFDTTKRLADVAAGLGVDMQRMILAYGQVKAAAYLKGTEVRQFTEAGVNVYSELQNFYKEVRGEEYTTGEIVKMISERKVTFEDVEAIFQRMTDKGGMFYNMQLIQSETLQGKMMKFQDAVDIMLNDIGTKSQGILTWFIDTATAATRNWERLAQIATTLGTIIASYSLARFIQQTILATAAYQRLRLHNKAFVAGLKVAVMQLKMFWATFKKFMATATVSTGIGLAIEGLMWIFSRAIENARRAREAAADAQKHYEEQAASLRLLTNEYGKLKKAREEAEGADEGVKAARAAKEANQGKTELENTSLKEANEGIELRAKDFDYDGYFNDLRRKFVEFLKEAKENSMQFDIDPFNLKEDKLQETFDEAIEQYKNFLYIAKRLEYEYGADDGFWEDAIDKDLEQYSQAVSVFLNKAPNSIEETLNVILANDGTYNNVTEAQKRTLERIGETIQEDRYDLASLIKDYKQLKDIVEEIDPNSTYTSPSSSVPIEIASELNTHLAKAKDSFNSLEEAAEEARKEVSAWLETERADIEAVTDPIGKNRLVKGLIDRQAMQQEWDATRKQLAAEVAQEKFGVTFVTEEDSVESSVNWAHEYISNFLQEHEYKIRFSSDGFGALPFDEIYKEGEAAVKAGQEAQKRLEQLQRAEMRAYTYDEYLQAHEKDRDAYEAPMTPLPAVWSESTEEMEGNLTAVLNQERESFEDYIRKRYNKEVMQKYIDAGLADEGDEETIGLAMQLAQQMVNAGRDTAELLGIDFATSSRRSSNDPLKDRVSLLKEMQRRYEKLTQVMSAYEAAQKVMTEYNAAIEEAGLRPFLDMDYTPTKQGTAQALGNILPTAPDSKSWTELEKDIAELQTEIEFEVNEQRLKAAKKRVEDAFKELELFRSLQDLGLSTYDIQQVFGDIASSYDDVERAMEEAMGGESGTKWEEAYGEQKKKLAEQRENQEIGEYKELVKAYGEQLSEQLQLDIWYHKERLKIQDNGRLDERTREQMQENLQRQYTQKTNENTWKGFQASGFYTRLFGDIEHQSNRMLRAMQSRLRGLGGSMKDLTPEQMKMMTEAQSRVDTQLAVNNPFKGLLKNILTYNARLRERRGLEREYLALLAEQQAIQVKIGGEDGQGGQARVTQEAKERLDLAYDNVGATYYGREALEEEWKTQQAILDTLKEQKHEIDEKLQATDAQLDANEQQRAATREQAQAALGYFDQAIAAAKALCDLMEDFGISVSDSTYTLIGGLSSAGEAIGAYYSGNYGQMVSGALSAIGSILSWASGDAAKQERIEKLQKAIESLQRKVEKLTGAMDEAWSTSRITNYEEASVEALEKEIATYLEMIAIEKSKKSTDSDQIEEWEEAIEDLYEEIEDLQESYTQSLGGIGESDYKAAAQEFADAWLEAFNTAESTLDALTDTFDDYWDTLLSSYITTTATEKFLSPLFEMIDEMAEYYASSGYDRDTWAEKLAELQDLSDGQLEALDDYLSGLMSALGITPNDTDSSLSALQQGIQGITEDTGAALESLINSMRFLLATQQADVAVIKTTLLSMANSADTPSTSTPMLTELKAQTALLESLDSRLSSVTKAGHPEGGRGLKVFMN